MTGRRRTPSVISGSPYIPLATCFLRCKPTHGRSFSASRHPALLRMQRHRLRCLPQHPSYAHLCRGARTGFAHCRNAVRHRTRHASLHGESTNGRTRTHAYVRVCVLSCISYARHGRLSAWQLTRRAGAVHGRSSTCRARIVRPLTGRRARPSLARDCHCKCQPTILATARLGVHMRPCPE